jgi:hypothetical protein
MTLQGPTLPCLSQPAPAIAAVAAVDAVMLTYAKVVHHLYVFGTVVTHEAALQICIELIPLRRVRPGAWRTAKHTLAVLSRPPP